MKHVGRDDCIIKKFIIGLIQAKIQYNKKAVEISNKVGFTKGNVDSFHYMNKNTKGVVYVALHK